MKGESNDGEVYINGEGDIEEKNGNGNIEEKSNEKIKALYLYLPNSFPEVEDFIHECVIK